MDENIIPAPRRKGRERRKNMTLSPQVSNKEGSSLRRHSSPQRHTRDLSISRK
ncbi:MAG: hypothetical protein ABIN54_09355 [candidate division WOR-3 bacterium]